MNTFYIVLNVIDALFKLIVIAGLILLLPSLWAGCKRELRELRRPPLSAQRKRIHQKMELLSKFSSDLTTEALEALSRLGLVERGGDKWTH